MKKILFTFILIMNLGNSIYAQVINNSEQERGRSAAFQFNMGINGSFSTFEIGLRVPFKEKNIFLGFNARGMSSLSWATYIDYKTGEMTSFHPVVVAGAVSFGGFSPLIYDHFRAYGGMDLLLGYSFTPYDDAINATGNLVGDNLTYGIYGFFGMEFYTAEKMAIFWDAGGGFKNILTSHKEDINVIAASWLGSGVLLRMGMRFYL